MADNTAYSYDQSSHFSFDNAENRAFYEKCESIHTFRTSIWFMHFFSPPKLIEAALSDSLVTVWGLAEKGRLVDR